MIGLLPLGRATFDTGYAEEKLAAVLARLDATGLDFAGPRTLLYDGDAADAALADLQKAGIERLLILQITFTDAATTLAATKLGVPMAIWAMPEPRLGGRLRLNAFCGLNLASHALGANGLRFGWLYGDGDQVSNADLADLLAGGRMTDPNVQTVTATPDGPAQYPHRLARIGAHPDGFSTCAYDADRLKAETGMDVEAIELDTLFDRAKAQSDTSDLRATLDLTGLEDVDQTELDRSLKLKLALDSVRAEGKFDAFAIRCWPETFTEYGGAVCGPVAMLGEARVPCACEADVYGAATQLILQDVAGDAVFLADLVDMDDADDSGVIWHCGQAPLSMIDPDVAAEATIHTNRKMPLLYQFPMKPGRITGFRLSQTAGGTRAVIATGEMLKRDMAFTGTSGVIRFDRGTAKTTEAMLNSGLEHHMAYAYGDHAVALAGRAAALGLEIVEL